MWVDLILAVCLKVDLESFAAEERHKTVYNTSNLLNYVIIGLEGDARDWELENIRQSQEYDYDRVLGYAWLITRVY